MPFSENAIITTIEHCMGARSAIHGAVRILAARLRLELTDDDVRELQIILDAADRMHAYHLHIRAELSRLEQEKRGRCSEQPSSSIPTTRSTS